LLADHDAWTNAEVIPFADIPSRFVQSATFLFEQGFQRIDVAGKFIGQLTGLFGTGQHRFGTFWFVFQFG